jgi:uncharacterized protein YeaO (DUF488 family)
MIRTKRIYEAPEKADGFRVLVDRLWPRGISKEKSAVGLWLKEIAPSDGLRKWFAHDPARWPEFKKKYREELKEHQKILKQIRDLEKGHGTITLVYAAKDEEHNNAIALKEII